MSFLWIPLVFAFALIYRSQYFINLNFMAFNRITINRTGSVTKLIWCRIKALLSDQTVSIWLIKRNRTQKLALSVDITLSARAQRMRVGKMLDEDFQAKHSQSALNQAKIVYKCLSAINRTKNYDTLVFFALLVVISNLLQIWDSKLSRKRICPLFICSLSGRFPKVLLSMVHTDEKSFLYLSNKKNTFLFRVVLLNNKHR